MTTGKGKRRKRHQARHDYTGGKITRDTRKPLDPEVDESEEESEEE